MILKCKTSNGWEYIDNVSNVGFEYLTKHKIQKIIDNPKEEQIGHLASGDLKPFLKIFYNSSDDSSHSFLFTVYLIGKNFKEAIQIITNHETYLMNDKGQTIEKIN